MARRGAGIWVRVTKNNFPEAAVRLPIAADNIVNGKRGPEMVEVARRHSRVDTGEMRDGWVWQATGSGRGRLTNHVPHTIYNEYGTVNMAAQPMARPAKEEVWPKIVTDFKKIGGELV